jgi:hypothetical protein
MNKVYTPAEVAQLSGAGFKITVPQVHRRAIISIEGLEKTGKSHLSLTAEGDITYLSLDIGMEGMVEKFLMQGKRIYTLELPSVVNLAVEFDKGRVETAYAQLRTAYLTALKVGGTIIIDTATELWELLRLARFGKLAQVTPNQYGPVNLEYRDLIRRAFDVPNVTLILLHKMKDEYIGMNRTGKYKRSGFADTGYLVQVMLECFKEENPAGGEPLFGFRVKECRHKASLAGLSLIGPMATIPCLLDLLHG